MSGALDFGFDFDFNFDFDFDFDFDFNFDFDFDLISTSASMSFRFAFQNNFPPMPVSASDWIFMGVPSPVNGFRFSLRLAKTCFL